MAIKVQGDTVIFDDKVFRPARMTTAERNAISSPSEGMMVYDTDVGKIHIYNGTDWEVNASSDVIIATPTISVTGDPDEIPENPTITTSAFTLIQGSDAHLSTDWEIRRTSNNEVVFSRTESTPSSNLTSIDVPSEILEDKTEYEFRARHRSTLQVSDFGSTTGIIDSFALADLGDPVRGGFYIGTICAAGQCYALIVAPNATGCACCQWKTTRTATAGTTSFVDGFSNTYGPMDNATHPAGNWTATRTINGFSDWYLPARDELNQLYVNDGGATNTNLPAGEGFAADLYWSSTESSAATACNQNFSNGNQSNNPFYLKTSNYRVRAVRRDPI